ncbi:MAG: SulP family inorganic anion transporter [Hyphomicrobiales bacterium]|nr:SulP family inorganic anion transporter [Hyphomicrobiales bacterium]
MSDHAIAAAAAQWRCGAGSASTSIRADSDVPQEVETSAIVQGPRPAARFWDLFSPKLVTVLREGYTLANFRQDALAGLTVAVVAIPLSMAIAIASGATPAAGLTSGIIGGFIVSALGGSRFQIGGPAGAFIVLVAKTIETQGYDGFLLATILAGVLLLALGYLRLGSLIKYIPHSVLVAFTAGIAVIIMASQMRDIFGLSVAHEPAAFVPKVAALWAARDTVNVAAVGVSLGTLAAIVAMKRWSPHFPGLLVAVAGAAILAYVLHLPVETIGQRFGALPSSPPAPHLPAFSFDKLMAVTPAAFAIALLGGIESLLSAAVADGMTGRRHRSNCELVAQGYANIASALFGGLCATGLIARTATNVRAHAYSPVAGMLHSVFVLAFMLVAGPLVSYVPLAALAAVLVIVSWNMMEKDEIRAIFRRDWAEAGIFLVTVGLTVFRDVSEAIAVGVTLGSLLFMHRIATVVEQTTQTKLFEPDVPDEIRRSGAHEFETAGGIASLSLRGPLFFGAAGFVSSVLDNIGERPRGFVLDLSRVPFIDDTAAHALIAFFKKAQKRNVKVAIAGIQPPVLHTIVHSGLPRRLVLLAPDFATAIQRLTKALDGAPDSEAAETTHRA